MNQDTKEPSKPASIDVGRSTAQRNAILSLTVGHAAATAIMGIIAAWLGDEPEPSIPIIVFVGLVFCQLGMLAHWAALSEQRAAVRWPCLVLGTAYLVAAYAIASLQWDTELLLFTLLTVFVVMSVGVGLRWFGYRILRSDQTASRRERYQFGIRHLLALMLMVAVVSAFVPMLRTDLFWAGMWFLLAGINLPFTLVALVSVWMLSRNFLPAAVAILLLTAVGCGWWLSRFIDDWQGFAFVGTEAALLIVSWLIVRRSGYRLRRHL